ncbi:helix-turn-helix domain-containing protein [Endozoicomonas gorgoniicola]|uniref:Helix-turn-helix domain-containing protein n=1 Tax=Endozoicomonas gorgoniicola TaxID=1234144 RepID=A0ABT3N4C5_9GAMM|nr:helix-turn-helix transcriptional regulator [Endozoicomonas gorgoniicola]MCW7556461.1 helix-turn-helix domain-containing protein [Endozoicomonas gorgoniicola]MCW7556518.1 helix-turn-helix domain-containing protein [Endozoicomonas gorgoniicola]
MDIRQIRRTNALQLIKEKGITKAKFARTLGKSPQQINELLKEKNPKNIGHKIARQIEESFGLPEQWLDQKQNQDESFTAFSTVLDSYRQAERLAATYTQAQRDWLKGRKHVTRQIEDELESRLLENGLQLLDSGNSEFRVATPSKSLVTISLFIPMPGFTGWLCPPITPMQPDFLAIALIGDYCLDFAFIPREEYQVLRSKEKPRIDINTKDGTASGKSLEPWVNRFDLI